MFQFPEGLYTDVRIEDVFEGMTKYQNGMIKDNKHRKYIGALIRIFDGNKWYYSSTTAVDQINEEIASLAQMATPNADIHEHPLVQSLEVHQEEVYKYQEKSICKITKEEQAKLLKTYGETVKKHEAVKEYTLLYKGNAVVKSFYSSKGASVVFDKQTCAIIVRYTLNIEGKRFDDVYDKTCLVFDDLKGIEDQLEEAIKVSKAYIKEAVPVEPGKYTVVLSPLATGVFAHESFGHKSEADTMLGSEAMKAEWTIGKTVGDSKLTIIDRGDIEGPGYTPFDDEGNRAKVNYLIKDGKLAGRLHTAATAQAIGEVPTGNARGMNFEFEPIVRMTSTYIDKGDLTKEELFGPIEDGIYVEDISHGSGMTDFTIAPRRAYRIRKGKIAEPVTVAVVTGNVMNTLYLIDGISNEVELLGFSGGGCGKLEQFPLPVGFGGPYIRVQNLNVQ